MSKKKKNTTEARERRDMTKFCAFWALAISAVMYIASGVMRFVTWLTGKLGGNSADFMGPLGRVSGVLQFIGNLALIFAIALPAYGYVRGKSRGWKVFYWIALAIFVFGIIFVFIPNY